MSTKHAETILKKCHLADVRKVLYPLPSVRRCPHLTIPLPPSLWTSFMDSPHAHEMAHGQEQYYIETNPCRKSLDNLFGTKLHEAPDYIRELYIALWYSLVLCVVWCQIDSQSSACKEWFCFPSALMVVIVSVAYGELDIGWFCYSICWRWHIIISHALEQRPPGSVYH